VMNTIYETCEQVVFGCRDPATYSGKLSNAFKSSERKKLVEEGYRIIGNIGDQWSDIVGDNIGLRTFKLPNPLYYD